MVEIIDFASERTKRLAPKQLPPWEITDAFIAKTKTLMDAQISKPVFPLAPEHSVDRWFCDVMRHLEALRRVITMDDDVISN